MQNFLDKVTLFLRREIVWFKWHFLNELWIRYHCSNRVDLDKHIYKRGCLYNNVNNNPTYNSPIFDRTLIGGLYIEIGGIQIIEITNRAAAELKSLFETEGIEQPAIRVYITGSSEDVQYGLAVADDINEYDVITENNGIKIVMSPEVAAGFSDGSIDFMADRTGKNFIIQNANTGTCDNCEECNICDAE